MSTDSPILPCGHQPGKRVSIALAISVHVLLAGFLFYGVRWQIKATNVVEVELVRAVAEPVAVPPAPTIQPPPVPEPKPEPKPLPKPDIVIKDKEKPKPPPKVEPKPRVDPVNVKDLLKRGEEEVAKHKNLNNAAQEAAQKGAAEANAARSKAIADYLGRIRSKIRGNIYLPSNIKGNPEAVFDVTQLPSGEILTVRLNRSSGNAALDAAIERAILKSNPLPKPQQADLFERSLELHFKPLDD